MSNQAAFSKSKIDLDPELIDNIARGSCVLFFGADYAPAQPGPPTRGQLAEALAQRYPDQVDPGQSLADAAQQFISRQPGNRHALIGHLRDQVAPAPAWPPSELHRAIVSLGFDAVVTAWYDDLLERAFEAAGKRVAKVVGAILAGYIGEALAKLGTEKHPGDRRLAEALLRALVTTKETKAALDEGELLEELAQAEADFDPAAELEAVRATRAALVNLRLLRSFQVGERSLVELAHDHMAVEISTWIDQAAMQPKLARELLRQQVESWRVHQLLIAPEALRLIHAQRERLRRLSPLEAELLLRSALAHSHEVVDWFDLACQAGVPADAIALEGLHSDSYRTRAAAVLALAQLGERFADPLIARLADDYPQVRAAAIASLERLRPDGAWRSHLTYECYVPAGEFIMGDNEDESSWRSVKTMAHPVYVDAFYIGKYPVTNAEYVRFIADLGRGFEMPLGKEQHPVTSVSWYDARDYAEWAGMRLLTEAEWEKAASWEGGEAGKEGRKQKYPWGCTLNRTKCNWGPEPSANAEARHSPKVRGPAGIRGWRLPRSRHDNSACCSAHPVLHCCPAKECTAMVATATAIYEKGTLRLLTPVSLPERARVRVQIQEEDRIEDDLQRAVAVLEASGLLKPARQSQSRQTVSPARRAQLAQLYATAGPLSEWIIAERDGR